MIKFYIKPNGQSERISLKTVVFSDISKFVQSFYTCLEKNHSK